MSTIIEQPPIQGPAPKPPRSRRALIVIILAIVTVVATAAVITIAVLSGKEEPRSAPGGQAQVPPPSAAPATPGQPAATPFRYQPLWPFANLDEVKVWQESHRSGGHAPWHLDADATALAFTNGYLGFTNVNVVVSHSITGDEALVAVGYPIE